MWTGQVARTERHGDRLDIIVTYVNGDGTNTLDQVISTNSTQDSLWLQNQITNKLNQLNDLDTFEQSINNNTIVSSTLVIDQTSQTLDVTPVTSEFISSIATPQETLINS